MRKSGNRKLLLLLLLFLLGFCLPAAATPAKPGAKERCAVCGMTVAPYPNWMATVVFRDGAQVFFDGPKDLFVYLFAPDKYPPRRKAEDIAAIYVTEYYTTRLLEAKEVYFVSGSDILGPMGSELVPVQGLANARTLAKEHGGKKIVQFDGAGFIDIAPTE